MNKSELNQTATVPGRQSRRAAHAWESQQHGFQQVPTLVHVALALTLRPSAHNGVCACHPSQTEILPTLTLTMTVSMSHTRFDSINAMQGTRTSRRPRCVRCALPCRAAPHTSSLRQRSHLPHY